MARILLAVLSLVGFDLFSQSIYSGIVKDSVSSKPLSYVNIGIVNKDVGTVSDKDGKFSITIDEKFNNDSLRISIVGYETRIFKISEFKSSVSGDGEIKLREYVHEL